MTIRVPYDRHITGANLCDQCHAGPPGNCLCRPDKPDEPPTCDYCGEVLPEGVAIHPACAEADAEDARRAELAAHAANYPWPCLDPDDVTF